MKKNQRSSIKKQKRKIKPKTGKGAQREGQAADALCPLAPKPTPTRVWNKLFHTHVIPYPWCILELLYILCISTLHLGASYTENAPRPIVLSGSSRTNRPLHIPPRGTTPAHRARPDTTAPEPPPLPLYPHPIKQSLRFHFFLFRIESAIASPFASAARPRRRMPPIKDFCPACSIADSIPSSPAW